MLIESSHHIEKKNPEQMRDDNSWFGNACVLYAETPEKKTGVPLRIRALSHHLINQIKAGEVVERPSDVLKELLENALDAQADKIVIHIENIGLDCLQVSDNGGGMNFHELPLAFERHFTSKVARFDDLFQLQSYGFRGEALAAICSVSRLTCQSLDRHGSGGKIELEEGRLSHHIPLFSKSYHISNRQNIHDHQDGESGTTITVKNLFFNTPVRLQFLKSKNHEKASLKKLLTSFLLVHPDKNFSITWDIDDKQIYPSYPTQDGSPDYLKRIQDTFFKKEKPFFIEKCLIYDQHKLEVFYFFSLQGHKKIPKFQYIFVNQRVIEDKKINHLIQKQLEHLSISSHIQSDCISFCLFFNLPPDQIDVNVHPHKTTIKFLKSAIVYSLVQQSLKNIQDHFPSKNMDIDLKESSPTTTLTFDIDKEKISNNDPSDHKKIHDQTYHSSSSETPFSCNFPNDFPKYSLKNFSDQKEHQFYFLHKSYYLFFLYCSPLLTCFDHLFHHREQYQQEVLLIPFQKKILSKYSVPHSILSHTLKSHLDIYFQTKKDHSDLSQELIYVSHIPSFILTHPHCDHLLSFLIDYLFSEKTNSLFFDKLNELSSKSTNENLRFISHWFYLLFHAFSEHILPKDPLNDVVENNKIFFSSHSLLESQLRWSSQYEMIKEFFSKNYFPLNDHVQNFDPYLFSITFSHQNNFYNFLNDTISKSFHQNKT